MKLQYQTQEKYFVFWTGFWKFVRRAASQPLSLNIIWPLTTYSSLILYFILLWSVLLAKAEFSLWSTLVWFSLYFYVFYWSECKSLAGVSVEHVWLRGPSFSLSASASSPSFVLVCWHYPNLNIPLWNHIRVSHGPRIWISPSSVGFCLPIRYLRMLGFICVNLTSNVKKKTDLCVKWTSQHPVSWCLFFATLKRGEIIDQRRSVWGSWPLNHSSIIMCRRMLMSEVKEVFVFLSHLAQRSASCAACKAFVFNKASLSPYQAFLHLLKPK